mmetsp:Transcript_47322/g.115233  ORF Transcript_47322/g.115233 Transcript_47322/m.115233 type:complete len:202 (-) Transcript_47322:162-767(-)|eukprot:CAMPEP_0206245148 /NCGR_PEP_ID=MMETSP0047_2-20121206/18540_1 /ASSEMBLY_ACC=CAM_ASM_000192 /TAXON_ID=195065 /ORGANISM="Chroomonas mesostigmatica_cf, Strain CCMP1168" /LENGTH=201 /DNA_ID=CAMNT_0053670423 /DNA_START=182 /DNA_END=787 /DNA_ORIENTATION=+
MRASNVSTLGVLFLAIGTAAAFSVPAAGGDLGKGFSPAPLKRQGASRELFESATSLYRKGKAASEAARRGVADTFTRTESVPHTEEQLVARDRWAGVRHFVRNSGQFKGAGSHVWATKADSEPEPSLNAQYDMAMGGMSRERLAKLTKAKSEASLNDQYDMAMGGMSKTRIAKLQYEAARQEELNDAVKQWKKLGGAEFPL